MAVTASQLKEYLRLPPDTVTVTGDATIDRAAFIAKVTEGGTYVFAKGEDGWTLNGSAVTLSEYGITAGETETEITVEYLTDQVDVYLNAAKSKAKAAGVPAYANNAQYDLFILALAAMYYDNRGMVFQNPADAANAQRMIDSFVLELRYATDDLYYLFITAGENTTVAVADSVGNEYANGALLAVGTVVTIAATAAEGYILSTFTVNGEAKTSPDTHTVTGVVTIVTAATEEGE